MKLMALLFSLLAGVAGAESLPGALPDPTRPPSAFANPQTGEAAASEPVLQSVLLPRSGRPTAVISGRTVRLGDLVGEARLVRLSETEAVLKGPAGIQRLRLTPDVEKEMVREKSGKKPSGKTKESP